MSSLSSPVLAAAPAKAQLMRRSQRLPTSCWPLALGASLMCFAERGAAQWQQNGSTLYTTTNRVGVGTPFPQGLLHVQGKPVLVWNSEPASILAINSLQNGKAYAVHASNESGGPRGESAALYGETKAKNNGVGVLGVASGAASIGIQGLSRTGGGSNPSLGSNTVYGVTFAPGAGVYGFVGDDGYGVSGSAHGSEARGVVGFATRDNGIGAEGRGNREGVFGRVLRSTGFAGVHGSVQSTSSYGVFSSGDFGATGNKYFVQPHPTDPATNLRLICLEGNESGTYFRGTMSLHKGHAEIPIPEDWQLVSDDAGITVQVTPRLGSARITIWKKSRENIIVKGTEDCEFDYVVNGVRRGFAKLQLRIDNRAYRPTAAGVPYGAELSDEVRSILVQNGTLNADYTPNEVTAGRLGWDLANPEEVAAKERLLRFAAENAAGANSR